MKKHVPMIAVAVVVAVAAFFGGMKYGQAKVSTPVDAQGQATGRQFGGGAARRGGAPGGGFTTGAILSKDAASITIQLNGGGSKIVFISTSTPVMKFAAGSSNDLAVGKQVAVTGTSNADGSVTAQSIQLRPDNRPAGN
jgi:hypothetical protein